MAAPYDHVRPTDSEVDCRPGVYRVVGTTGDSVTLLLVADESGRRRHTGHVVRVDRDRYDERFEPAENPGDGGFGSLLRALSAMVRSAFGRL